MIIPQIMRQQTFLQVLLQLWSLSQQGQQVSKHPAKQSKNLQNL
jgi:hypothetical protein